MSRTPASGPPHRPAARRRKLRHPERSARNATKPGPRIDSPPRPARDRATARPNPATARANCARRGAAGPRGVHRRARRPNAIGARGPVEVGFAAEHRGPTFPSAWREWRFVSDGAGGYVEESLGEPDADVTLPATVMGAIVVQARALAIPGNKTPCRGERIAVSARGPAEDRSSPSTPPMRSPRRSPPGAYSVARRGRPPPRMAPSVTGCGGAVRTDRCVISGDGWQLQDGETPRAAPGGDRFATRVIRGHDRGVRQAQERSGAREDADGDNGDVTRRRDATLSRASQFALQRQRAGDASRYFLAPSLAPLAASDGVVRGARGDPEPRHVHALLQLRTPSDRCRAGRRGR